MNGAEENIKLLLPPEQEADIKGIFARLAERGLPRHNQTPLIPCQCERKGMVIFGTKRKQTVAWLLEAPAEREEAARAVY